MFQEFAQHQRSFSMVTPIAQYRIISNEAGATILDITTMREVHILGCLVFFPGQDGIYQAAQYIQEYGTLVSQN